MLYKKNYGDSSKSLRNSSVAAAYLTEAATKGNIEAFLIALRNVLEAQTNGVERLSSKLGLEKEEILQILSSQSNPKLIGLEWVLDSLGFRIAIVEKELSN